MSNRFSSYKPVLRQVFDTEESVNKNGGVSDSVTFNNDYADFNGSSSEINYSDAKFASLQTTFSVRAIIKPTSTSISDAIILKTSSNYEIGLTYHNNSYVYFYVTSGANNVRKQIVLSDGFYHEIIGTYDGTTIILYIDGVQVASSPYSVASNAVQTFNIGGANYEGSIKLIELYDKSLTASEVTNFYSNTWNTELNNTNHNSMGITSFTNGTTYPLDTFSSTGNNVTGSVTSNWAGCDSNSFSVTKGEIYKVTFDYTKNSGDDLRILIAATAGGADLAVSNNYKISSSGKVIKYFNVYSTDSTAYLQLGTGSGTASIDFSASNITLEKVSPTKLLDFDYSGDSVTGDIISDQLAVNNSFSEDSNWTLHSAVSISNGNLVIPSDADFAAASQELHIFKGSAYRVIFTISDYTSGTLSITFGASGTTTTLGSAVGTYSFDVLHSGSSDEIYIRGGLDASNFVGSISNFSVFEIRKDLSYTDTEVTNHGIVFDSSNSKIDTGSDLISTKDVTVYAWVKPFKITTGGRILDNGNFLMLINSTTNRGLQVSSVSGTYVNSDDNIFSEGEYTFIAYTRTVQGVGNIYVGGKDVAPYLASASDFSSGTPTKGTQHLFVGNYASGGYSFNGVIPRVVIFEGILSINDITRFWSETRKEIK